MIGRQRARAFTLLEMLAVLLLIALGMSLLSYALQRAVVSAQGRQTSRDLVVALRAARVAAITRGEPASVVFDLQLPGYHLAEHPMQHLPDGMLLRVTSAAGRVPGQALITFLPAGTSTGGRIELAWNGRLWQVDVAWLTGRVSSQEVSAP
ncbi:MAG: hypothetical protein GAK43_02544 [Stenotrophomonas maltophilia]|nr:MAG: hypothetical protein GAK43_02544 [Stenotrophomonas maltophilia]